MPLQQFLKNSFDIEFPTQEQLENLRYYKYAAVDKSYVTKYILSHYWNWAITLFPMWIAPNLITLIGLGFMMSSVLLVTYYVPDFSSETTAPSWIYFVFAASLWLYSTFDNVDGKQARRTGTSSPLGELFDHGCDALNTTFVAILQCAALGLGHSGKAAAVLITCVAGFYLSTAEEYYTKVLYLGYVNGPTEGILLTCFAFIWSGCFGPASWHVPLSEGVPFLAWPFPENTTAADVFVWSLVLFFAVTICIPVFYSIYTVCRDKNLDCVHAFMNVGFPIVVFCLAEYCWIMSPTSSILKDKHLCLFALTAGTLFGLMASSIILAHLTRSPYPNLAPMVCPVVFMAVLVNTDMFFGTRLLSPQAEYGLLWLTFIVACVCYGVWATLVIDGFCRFLGIRCLVIRRQKQPDQRVSTEGKDFSCGETNRQNALLYDRL
ncbi:CDP-alcohol phosphatidyltransferase-domain-containing protein [Zychaea mexicana]|uniref:CDP-alcohol phosphatidyltransferase-domain-containing protein n=1 Tax=Zychaea mexicana TaxID=64656 RepID=UPI0022FDD783|nr:CDP-alcohol phosphatidyltransferase-domain-containing protein [Zychaea mexicana]KAI9498001.1 CDP-alcohol phosphatidyltransferase-domain-containing protein [Zychaea mexicana]